MANIVYVTRAEVKAAKTLVWRSSITGRPVSSAIQKIANAKPAPPDASSEPAPSKSS